MNNTEKIMNYIIENKNNNIKHCKKYKAENLLKPFSKSDWYGYEGASEMEIGGPFIYQDKDSVVIVSGTGDEDGKSIIEFEMIEHI